MLQHIAAFNASQVKKHFNGKPLFTVAAGSGRSVTIALMIISCNRLDAQLLTIVLAVADTICIIICNIAIYKCALIIIIIIIVFTR